MLRALFVALLTLFCVSWGCSKTVNTAAPPATADLINAKGEKIGTASLIEVGDGVRLNLQVSGLSPGDHGFHIHEKGRCEPPDFESAGGHFNPTGKQHGFEVAGGPHLGDLLNLKVDASGKAAAERTISGVNLKSGNRSLVGRAIVIHEKPDDYQSQPSGNAGKRVACGEIMRSLTSYAPYTGT